MKGLIFGFLLGVAFLKCSETAYSYAWWSAEASPECRKSLEMDDIFSCVYKKMGPVKYLGYVNANLLYMFQKWEIRN